MRKITSQLRQIVSCPLLPTFLVRRLVAGSVCSAGVEGNSLPTAFESDCPARETELKGHAHAVQLLKNECVDSPNRETEGNDDSQLSALFGADDTTTKSCQQRMLLGLSTVADVQRNPSSLGRGQRRNLSSMTKVLAPIFVAAQHLDSSYADSWNRTVCFGRPDLLEVCANSDSPRTQAVENAGGQGVRTSFWHADDFTTRRGRERLYLFCSAKRPRHVCFSSPCRSHSSISGAVAQRVSRIVNGIATVSPRLQPLACHVHFEPQLGAHSWKQSSALDMSKEMLEAATNGCAWGLRDSHGSLLNRSWRVLTTSPDIQCCGTGTCTTVSVIAATRFPCNFRDHCVKHWRDNVGKQKVATCSCAQAWKEQTRSRNPTPQKMEKG